MKTGRNDPCPCGSGKKYKQCCAQVTQPSSAPPPETFNALRALYNAGRDAELESQAHALLQQYPYYGIGWKLLAACMERQGKDSLHCFQKAAACLPDDTEAHNNLAHILHRAGQLTDAKNSCTRALAINPQFAPVHNTLGSILLDLDQPQEAADSFRRALAIRPDFVEAHYNLGNALVALGQSSEAIVCYQQALLFTPGHALILNNLGAALQDLGRYDEAAQCYREVLAQMPDYTDTHSNLLYAMNASPHSTTEECLAEALRFGAAATHNATVPYSSWLYPANPDKLRVGIVSGDLRNHSVGHFLEGLLANLDLSSIELIAYSSNPVEDALTARIRPRFAAWKNLHGLSDQQAAQLIHQDGIHILMDLAWHTAGNRLPVFAWKPSPVQVTWLGFPATTGLAEMDYLIGDPYATPPENASQFTEQIWRLPETYICLTPPGEAPAVSPLPALMQGYVTFGSFNNLNKIHDKVLDVWSHILNAAPQSRLLLKTLQLQNVSIADTLRQKFSRHGISPDRLILVGTVPHRADHLAMYHRVDIGLDTFPYPGVTTSAEAIWMGVPVLSMQGDRFLSRTAASIAHNVGLPGWIAANKQEYVEKAVRFASDLPGLATLRAGLRDQAQASPLFNAARFAKNFKQALWAMWREKQNALEHR